ncbi:YSC84-related protein [uncultured Algibacter sp.]|uniref:lipid-binding SYLF domain-containing protein n=1 Tax=uncultured Algibacter sp. TaxID=298659 RepID=UPI0026246DAF|nr:YSC84-related protein [uncultured Algibacter sp.]
MNSIKQFSSLCTIFLFTITLTAQVGGWKPELKTDADTALSKMLERSPKLHTFKNEAYAYAVFPKITKAGVGIGGAAGKGIVYKNNTAVGSSKLKQASIGLQLGGQQYSEVIFFEDQEAFEHFTNGNLKFDGQASAVAITKGASVDVAYKNGVAVFTHTKGGLMYEASLGGQHFTYEAGE